jgi:hypothetical protein
MKKHTLTAGEFIYFLAYTVFIGVNILYSSMYRTLIGNTVHTLCEASALLLLVIKLCMYREFPFKEYRKLIPIGIFMVLMLVNTKGLDEFGIVITLVFLFCSADVSMKRLARYTIWLTLALILFIYGSAKAGIIMDYYTETPRLRYYMGFSYSLNGPGYILNTAMLACLLSEKKVPKLEWAAILIMAVWAYHLTNSRMPFLLTILMFAALVLYRIWPAFFTNKAISTIMIWSFVIFGALAILACALYDDHIGWMATLNSDRLFAGRLSLAHNSLQQFGISLIGKKITWGGHGLSANAMETSGLVYNYVDCLYVKLLQRGGILFYILINAFIVYVLNKAKKQKYFTLLIASAVIAVRCMIDDLSLFSYYNSLWFVLPLYLNFISAESDTSAQIKFNG